uniref:Nucleosome assembly protein n=1 Tax=Vitrella brassicaformis TaxID=1169539 RepID=A0A7S1JMG6_9ALVE|mmetsp:Transcript_15844/g.37796  ORF Transcript_15844/g.37796 Transcript_15844/m.37796 type:complete len:270 (+) Transcript_15844:2417-3226(+)
MKRAAEGPEEDVNGHPAKRVARDGVAEEEDEVKEDFGGFPSEETMNELENIQKELFKLDDECAKEQMEVQKKYDKQKKPAFDKRNEIIAAIPQFWLQAFKNHKGIYIHQEDEELLGHLKTIEVDDNLDHMGSYKLTFHFEPNDFLESLTMSKKTTILDGNDEVCEISPIVWQENMDIVSRIRERRKQQQEKGESPVDSDYSLFEWFTQEAPDDIPDLGEVIRRELWHDPLQYYLEECDEGGLIDEEEGEEEEDEAEGEEYTPMDGSLVR